MPTIYLDQNVLIPLGRDRRTQSAETLRQRILDGDAGLVLSPAHWVETARGASEENSLELARFIDFLNPKWLLERIALHRLELNGFLQDIPFAAVREQGVVATVTEVVADINQIIGTVPNVTAEDIVCGIRRNAHARQQLERAYTQNDRASNINRGIFLDGQITAEVERDLELAYLRRLGGIQQYSENDRKIQNVPREVIPSIVIEWEVTKAYWERGGGMRRRRFHDLQTLTVAMPYVDAILTLDNEMRGIANALARSVPFQVATIVGSIQELVELVDAAEC